MATTRVVVPLDVGLHDLDPDRQVFPILRADTTGHTTVGIGFDENAAIVATVEDESAAPEMAKLLSATAIAAGLRPGPAVAMSKAEYDARALAGVHPDALVVDDDV